MERHADKEVAAALCIDVAEVEAHIRGVRA